MAVWSRRPGAGGMPHAKPGGQDTSLRCGFGARCHSRGIRCSRGAVGDCEDNARVARFCATVAGALLARPACRAHRVARTALVAYIAVFSHWPRRHAALGYLWLSLARHVCEEAYASRWTTQTLAAA